MIHHAQLPRQVKVKHKLSSALLRRTLSVVCSLPQIANPVRFDILRIDVYDII